MTAQFWSPSSQVSHITMCWLCSSRSWREKRKQKFVNQSLSTEEEDVESSSITQLLIYHSVSGITRYTSGREFGKAETKPMPVSRV